LQREASVRREQSFADQTKRECAGTSKEKVIEKIPPTVKQKKSNKRTQ